MTIESYPVILTALCLWREARNQPDDAKRGVLWVILNRAQVGFRGTDPVTVILAPYQFSSFNANDPNAHLMPNPKNAGDWAAWVQCCNVVDNPGSDPTGGAVMYHSYEFGDPRWPAWATSDKLSAQIGPFRFYKA